MLSFCKLTQWIITEASLSGVEPLIQKIQSEIRRVDADILAAVRQQVCSRLFCALIVSLYLFIELWSWKPFLLVITDCVILHAKSNSGTKAKEDLAAATHAVQVHFFPLYDCLPGIFMIKHQLLTSTGVLLTHQVIVIFVLHVTPVLEASAETFSSLNFVSILVWLSYWY